MNSYRRYKHIKLNHAVVIMFLIAFAVLTVHGMSQPACLPQVLLGSVYNKYTSSTVEIVVSSGILRFSPDTIFIHSKDTVYWKNTCDISNTVFSDYKTLRGNLDIGTLNSGEISRPFTDFAIGTAYFHIKSKSKSSDGVIIVLPVPASAYPWILYSKEEIINNQSSISMGDGPFETDPHSFDPSPKSKNSDVKTSLQFGGSIQISGQFRHQN